MVIAALFYILGAWVVALGILAVDHYRFWKRMGYYK